MIGFSEIKQQSLFDSPPIPQVSTRERRVEKPGQDLANTRKSFGL